MHIKKFNEHPVIIRHDFLDTKLPFTPNVTLAVKLFKNAIELILLLSTLCTIHKFKSLSCFNLLFDDFEKKK